MKICKMITWGIRIKSPFTNWKEATQKTSLQIVYVYLNSGRWELLISEELFTCLQLHTTVIWKGQLEAGKIDL